MNKIRFLSALLGQLLLTNQLVRADELIESYKIEKNSVYVTVNKEFKEKYLTEEIFFASYDNDVDLSKMDASIVLMPFLLNVLTIVWISGKEYWVDSLDKDFFEAAKKLKKVFRRMYPKTNWSGRLRARNLVENKHETLKNPAKEIALLFSAGLDSTCSSLYHNDKKQLLITIWGPYDLPLDNPQLWEERKQEFIDFAKKHGHQNSFVKSNYGKILNWDILSNLSKEITDWRIDANEGIGLTGLAAPILYSKGYQSLYIASSFTWNYPYPTAANPFVDNNITFAQGISVVHDLFNLTRLDKLSLIVRKAKEKKWNIPFMKVCNGRRNYNCVYNCSKCAQTYVALLALNEDPRKWGFDMKQEMALRKIQKRLHIKEDIGYWERWNFLCIQEKLKKMVATGQTIPESLTWVLEFNFSENIAYGHVKYKVPAHWKDFRDLAPKSGLFIPHFKPLALNYKNSIERDLAGETIEPVIKPKNLSIPKIAQ